MIESDNDENIEEANVVLRAENLFADDGPLFENIDEQNENVNLHDNNWNEEDFIIEEELDPDVVHMMEVEHGRRMLELENLPFVQVLLVIPPTSPNSNENLCVVCTVSVKTHAFVPCGHRAVCGDSPILLEPQRCPLCNQSFTAYLRIWE